MAEQLEFLPEERRQFDPQRAAEQIRKTGVQPSPIVPEPSPELGPDIPKVIEQIEPARRAEEERLIREQQERTRLRNLGVMGAPTDLVYTDLRGQEKRFKADVDMRHGFTPNVQEFDIRATSKIDRNFNPEGRALFATNFPRREDGSVGNPDGTPFTMNQFILQNVLPFVSAEMGGTDLGAFAAKGDTQRRGVREILAKATYEILRNNRNALEYFRENDPEGMAKFIASLDELDVVQVVGEYGQEFKTGDKAERLREMTVRLPTEPLLMNKFVDTTFRLPKFLGGTKEVTLDSPFNEKLIQQVKEYSDADISAKRTGTWHGAYAAALIQELAGGIGGGFEVTREGKTRYITPAESRSRSLTDFLEGPFGKALGFTPKGVGELANTLVDYLPLSEAVGYKKFTPEELNDPNLTVSDITGTSGESISDLIMYSIAKKVPSAFAYSPEDIAALDEITDARGMEADVTIAGGAARLDPLTKKEVMYEGKALGDDITDIFGGATALFGISAVATAAMRNLGKSTVRSSLLKGQKRKADVEANIYQDGKISRAELSKALKALDEGKDVAGLGALNLRVPFTKWKFLKESIIRNTNHPMRTAVGMQGMYALSIGAVEGTQEILYNEKTGKFVNPFTGNEMSTAAATGFTLLSAFLAPVLSVSIAAGLTKFGYNKTLASVVDRINDPEFFSVMEAIRNRAPTTSYGKRSGITKKIQDAMINLRDEFPEEFDIIYRAREEMEAGNEVYRKNALEAGLSKEEVEQDLQNMRDATNHATAYLYLASASSYYDQASKLNIIKGGLSRKKMARLAKQAQEAALVEANAANAQLNLAQIIAKQLRVLENRQTKTTDVGDAAGLDRAMLRQQEQLAKMLRLNIGGVNPDELVPAMKTLFNTADDLANGVVDTAEATSIVKNAIQRLTSKTDQDIFTANVFMASERGNIKNFEKVIDNALPDLRAAIVARDDAVRQFKNIVTSGIPFKESGGSPVRPKNTAPEQHNLVMLAYKAAKEKSDEKYDAAYRITGTQPIIDDENFNIINLIDALDEARKNQDFGITATRKLRGLYNETATINDDVKKYLAARRKAEADNTDIDLEGINTENLYMSFRQAHQLRSDIGDAMYAEFRKGASDGGYINLLGQTYEQIDDGMESFLARPQNEAARNAFNDAQTNWKNTVANVFYNNRVLRMTKEEKFENLFAKIFSAKSMDGQRETFEIMFPVGSKNRARAVELLREQMIRNVMGNETNMSSEAFQVALRNKVRNLEPGMFGLPMQVPGVLKAGIPPTTRGGFLDFLLGGTKQAQDYVAGDMILPKINKQGGVDIDAPLVKLDAETYTDLSKISFYNAKKLALRDGDILNEKIDSAARQINVLTLDEVDEINKKYWLGLSKQNQPDGFADTTIDHILGSGRANDGTQARDRYLALVEDMRKLVGVDDADRYQELINRALIFDVKKQYIQRTKALDPAANITEQKITLNEGMEGRKQYWIQYEQLWREAFKNDADSIAHGLDMASIAEQPARSVLAFAETVNRLSANGMLSRAWGAARGVVSLRYIGSEILLRNMLNDNSEILMRVMSTPELSPYIMDAVKYGKTPPKIQRYFKTQFTAAMIAMKDDPTEIEDIQKHMNGFFKAAQEANVDPVQLIMSMYFTAQNPELSRRLQIDLEEIAKGRPSRLPAIMQESISTPPGVRERLRPKGTRSPLLEQLSNLGLADGR